MNKTYVWFGGSSAVGKTWLIEKCAQSVELCLSLDLQVHCLDEVRVVGKLADESALMSVAAAQKPFFFIHWQTAYDRGGYGVQRLMELDGTATHIVIEIHRDEHERWTAFQRKEFIASASEDDRRRRFINWPETDYETIRQHEGKVSRYVRAFLVGDSVFRMDQIRRSR